MEEKLVKLFMVAKEFSTKSEKFYVETKYSGSDNEIEMCIRLKKEHEYVETREIFLNNSNIDKINELIEFIKSYEEK